MTTQISKCKDSKIYQLRVGDACFIQYGIRMEEFLDKCKSEKIYKTTTKQKYYFIYTIKANIDSDVYKVGKSETGLSRLTMYRHDYGDFESKTKKGCKLYYLERVKNATIGFATGRPKKVVRFRETVLIDSMKLYGKLVGRGGERFKIKNKDVLPALKAYKQKFKEDTQSGKLSKENERNAMYEANTEKTTSADGGQTYTRGPNITPKEKDMVEYGGRDMDDPLLVGGRETQIIATKTVKKKITHKTQQQRANKKAKDKAKRTAEKQKKGSKDDDGDPLLA